MVDPKIVESWIRKADEDFQYAKFGLDEGLELYALVCFHFHQAVEKYLKAYIVANELTFQKTHELTKLLKTCAEKDKEFDIFSEKVAEMNPLYVETRYPEFMEGILKSDAETALKTAQEVASFVKIKLK